MIMLIKSGYGLAVLPEKASEDSGIVYIPLDGITPIPYGVFYKDTANNPSLRKLISIIHNIGI